MFQEDWNPQDCAQQISNFSKIHFSKKNNEIFSGGNESSIVRVVGAKRIPLAKKRPQSIDTSPTAPLLYA